MTTSHVFPERSDPIGWGCVLAAAVLVWALAISPSSAQASNNDRKETQTQQRGKGSEQPAKGDKAADNPSDLESCKRDADGMKGPERSRFMTACLKERK